MHAILKQKQILIKHKVLQSQIGALCSAEGRLFRSYLQVSKYGSRVQIQLGMM